MAKVDTRKCGELICGDIEANLLPYWFSEYGFQYGDYDPGAMAAIAIGCLYVFMKTGDSRAGGPGPRAYWTTCGSTGRARITRTSIKPTGITAG